MKCTYCKSEVAYWRPFDLSDERRACEWCILRVPDRDDGWMWIMDVAEESGGMWFSLQELRPLSYRNVTRAYVI